MDIHILKKLREWRDETAKKEGVENYRVIPNSAIEEIARLLPRTKEELTNIKGIKDKKFYKYGRDIFDVLNNAHGDIDTVNDRMGQIFSRNMTHAEKIEENTSQSSDKIFSVGDYLDFLNEKLFMCGRARIKGEITNVDVRERVIYFSLKDSTDESIINCLIFKYNYNISGIVLEAGSEVVITAVPEIYKPMGKLSLKTSLIEISGEGPLKKSYDELKAKLEKEGIFSPDRKKTIPKLPRIIGLITSNQGAAIGDFITNIGNYGIKIKFINSSVEGKQAIFDLINAVRTAKKLQDLDVLAIVRGGGSLESLQAFNNEALIRELIGLNIPVICGVGHEKDISLVSLASDLSVSTPTAAAFAIRETWDSALNEIEYLKDAILDAFGKILFKNKSYFENNINYGIRSGMNSIMNKFTYIIDSIKLCQNKLDGEIEKKKGLLNLIGRDIFIGYDNALYRAREMIRSAELAIASNDPDRQLRLGYSISYFNGKIIRSVKDISKNDRILTRVKDGKIDSVVMNKLTDK